jgi:L-ribulose-5-phosphate 4-epimerase
MEAKEERARRQLVHEAARREVLVFAQRMLAERLVNWTAGNVSRRIEDSPGLFAVTPTSVPYDVMAPSDILIVTLDGDVIDGSLPPTSELPLHTLVYRSRPDVGAVVHTHGAASVAMAALGWGLPPFLPAIVAWAGGAIACTPYARAGTEEIAHVTAAALADRSACFLGNHGLLAIGRSLPYAYGAASMVEAAADAYLKARLLGNVPELEAAEIERLRGAWMRRWGRRAGSVASPTPHPSFIAGA